MKATERLLGGFVSITRAFLDWYRRAHPSDLNASPGQMARIHHCSFLNDLKVKSTHASPIQ